MLTRGFTDKEKEERYHKARAAILKQYPTITRYIKEKRVTRATAINLSLIVNSSAISDYLEFCRYFKLDPIDMENIDCFDENRKINLLENRILAMYCDLNRKGRIRFFELLYDLWSIEKYRRV